MCYVVDVVVAMKLSEAQKEALRYVHGFMERYPKALGALEGVDVRVSTSDALVARGLFSRTFQERWHETRHGRGDGKYWSRRWCKFFYVKLTDAGRAALAEG